MTARLFPRRVSVGSIRQLHHFHYEGIEYTWLICHGTGLSARIHATNSETGVEKKFELTEMVDYYDAPPGDSVLHLK